MKLTLIEKYAKITAYNMARTQNGRLEAFYGFSRERRTPYLDTLNLLRRSNPRVADFLAGVKPIESSKFSPNLPFVSAPGPNYLGVIATPFGSDRSGRARLLIDSLGNVTDFPIKDDPSVSTPVIYAIVPREIDASEYQMFYEGGGEKLINGKAVKAAIDIFTDPANANSGFTIYVQEGFNFIIAKKPGERRAREKMLEAHRIE